jgi:hypothetical protein
VAETIVKIRDFHRVTEALAALATGVGAAEAGLVSSKKEKIMSTILLIVVLVLLFGGGGGYYWTRGRR